MKLADKIIILYELGSLSRNVSVECWTDCWFSVFTFSNSIQISDVELNVLILCTCNLALHC